MSRSITLPPILSVCMYLSFLIVLVSSLSSLCARNNRVSKMKRWQQRAQKLLEAARSKLAVAAAAAAGDKQGGGGEALRQRIEVALAELEDELKVSGVPEALELSCLLQVGCYQGGRGGGVQRYV